MLGFHGLFKVIQLLAQGLQIQRVLVGIFVKQKNVVSHDDSMSENEEQVMFRGIVLSAKLEKLVQRSLRAILLTKSISISGCHDRRFGRIVFRTIWPKQLCDSVADFFAVARLLAIPQLVFNQVSL